MTRPNFSWSGQKQRLIYQYTFSSQCSNRDNLLVNLFVLQLYICNQYKVCCNLVVTLCITGHPYSTKKIYPLGICGSQHCRYLPLSLTLINFLS